MAKFSGQSGRVGRLGLLADFAFYMVVSGVERSPTGFVTPWRFKMLDSQPEKSNIGPLSTNAHDFETFEKSCDDSLARYLPCFRPGALRKQFPSVLVGTQKLRDKKLCRFVVVSPREVSSLTFSCPFEIFVFWSILKASAIFLSRSSRKSVH